MAPDWGGQAPPEQVPGVRHPGIEDGRPSSIWMTPWPSGLMAWN
jgi:hypothetical protein